MCNLAPSLIFNIVIPVFKRLHSLQRLLHSIECAVVKGSMNLYISCDGGATDEVVTYAQGYVWRYGTFEVIKQKVQLGVDAHNLACMKLAKKLGNVVVLEDDLVVSPSFQLYLISAHPLAKSEKKMAGISLYRYPMVEQNHFPFDLIPNDEFVYYQQRSSSNGCFYTWDMLRPYFDFLAIFDGDFESYNLPENVKKWGDEVWEKRFYCYLQYAELYLAFPRFSLTTDFADIGVHMKKQTNKYAHQSSLYLGEKFELPARFENTENVYDAHYEIHRSTLIRYLPMLEGYDLEVDMYGYKKLEKITKPFLLSSKKCKRAIHRWDRRLKPELNNILLNESGHFYSLGLTSDFSVHTSESLKEKFLYYYPDTRLTSLIKMKLLEIISRFRR